MVLYTIVTGIFGNNLKAYVIPSSAAPFVVLSLFMLKWKKYETSAALMLFSMFLGNFMGTYLSNTSMEALVGVMIHPYFASFATSSRKVHMLNSGFCVCLLLYNSQRIREIFAITLDDEQSKQIDLLLAGGKVMVLVVCIVTILQKNMEINMRNLVRSNQEKSESVTKDVVQAMEAKDAFVSMLSHELKNPLNALKGSIDYLGEIIKDPIGIKLIKTAKLSGEILLNLLTNVLDAAKLKSDKMEICRMETDVVEIIKKVFTINSDRLREKNIFGQAFIDRRLPDTIWADPSRLLQIFMNLISNALKFTQTGGKINIYVSWFSIDQDKKSLLAPLADLKYDEPRMINLEKNTVRRRFESQVNSLRSLISNDELLYGCDEFSDQEAKNRKENLDTLRDSNIHFINKLSDSAHTNSPAEVDPWVIRQTGLPESPMYNNNSSPDGRHHGQKRYLKVQITDTGCGIPEDSLPKLFGMFEQVAQQARPEEGGTGLGLWICKQLCQRMGGDITLYSKMDKGTSFVFYILVDNERIMQASSTSLQKPISREKLKALVVDDYSVNRYLHSLLLEREEVEVMMASDGKEAVEKYTSGQNQFDLIFMDVQMPEMDGFAAAKEIRKWEMRQNKKRVEIYFVTGEYYNEESVKADFRDRGGMMDGVKCLRKPVDSEMIKKVIALYKQKFD